MKAIFSRKGYDSRYGRYPSIILPNNDMLSFPIPAQSGILSQNLMYDNRSLSQIFNDLGHRQTNLNHHLDPDLGRYSIDGNQSPAIGIFGQANAAGTHLRNQGINIGDIFLFFGTFKTVEFRNERISYSNESAFHAIFGYLIIDEIITDFFNVPSRYQTHPHYAYRNQLNNNIMYGSNRFGCFSYNPMLRLTQEGSHRKSLWSLPDCFNNVRITYNQLGQKVNGNCILQTPGMGQEFVFEITNEIIEWINNLSDNPIIT